MSVSNSQVRQSNADGSLLEIILEGTASETGEGFLSALVRSLARALGVDGAWVTEYLKGPKRLRVFSFWFRDHYVPDYEYDIRGTQCEPVLEQKCLVRYPENVTQLFPRDPDLAPLNAVGYMGIPFLDDDGSILGHLAVLDSKPLPSDSKLEAIFRIFAVRASAELRRMRAESRIRMSEERFVRLFESAMDAIVELDQALNVCRANRSALDTFGITDREATERSFVQFLTDESADKLRLLSRKLDMDIDLARVNRIPADWGLDVGVLAEIFRNCAVSRTCQVDLTDNYEHKHQALSTGDPSKGLARMATDIAKSLFVTLASEGIVFTGDHFRSLELRYVRMAQDTIARYYADAMLNGLKFDRHSEERPWLLSRRASKGLRMNSSCTHAVCR